MFSYFSQINNYIFYRIQPAFGKQIEKECGKIFPLQNVLVKKVKLLKKPKFDLTKLMELYQSKPEDVAQDKKKEDAPKNLLAEKAAAKEQKK
jgi:small subunit ribosomal protein S3Ae